MTEYDYFTLLHKCECVFEFEAWIWSMLIVPSELAKAIYVSIFVSLDWSL